MKDSLKSEDDYHQDNDQIELAFFDWTIQAGVKLFKSF